MPDITAAHDFAGIIGGQACYGGITAGRPMTWVRNHCRLASTWLQAFSAGPAVLDCQKAAITETQLAATPAMTVYPDALRMAMDGLPTSWVRAVGKPAR